MKNKDIIKRAALSLTGAAILFSLITPAIGIECPAEPFQKAMVMALMEGVINESRGKKAYILIREGWGAIVYNSEKEDISLIKGTLKDYVGVFYRGESCRYHVTHRIEGRKTEKKIVDWSVAMEIADKYLREIKAVQGGMR